MKITWLGHACFLIETVDGIKILTDPFDNQLRYPEPRVFPQIVTVSHQHFDHCAVNVVGGKPRVVQTEGRHLLPGVVIIGIHSFHDSSRGALRGENLIFIIEAEGLRICHLGDLGHMLEKTLAEKIGNIDVLMIPVGGFYTINASEAKKVTVQINPLYVVPMHYKTKYLDFPISPVEDFLNDYPDYVKQSELEITAGWLASKQQVVLLEL